MRHILSGTVLAAALALAIPACAQSPTAPNPSNQPAASEATPSKPHAARKAGHARASHRTQMKHATMHSYHARHVAARMHHPTRRMGAAHKGMGPNDNVAAQLNQQELQRMSGSSMPQAGYPAQQPGYAPPAPSYQGR